MNIVFFTICVFLLSIPGFQGLEFNLKRIKPIRQHLLEKDVDLEQLRILSPKPPKPRDNDTVSIYKYFDTDFYAQITIGSNRQHFNMFLDISWGDTYVPSIFCPLTSVACAMHNKYDSSKSNTYIANGTDITIANMTGFVSSDTFHVGASNIQNQSFIEMTSMEIIQVFTKADGVLGLGFQKLNHLQQKAFIYNYFNQSTVPEKTFSFYLNRDMTTDHAGLLIFGKSNHKHYEGELKYLQAKDQYFWRIQMSKIYSKVKNVNYTFCDKGCNAILDTRQNIIGGPAKDIERINRLIGATKIDLKYLDRYAIHCDLVPKLPHFNFTIANTNFTLHGKDLAVELIVLNITKICLSVFVPNDFVDAYKNDWILGIPFFKRAYVKFDPYRIVVGLAKVK